MHRQWMLALLLTGIAPAAHAQEFRWTKGEALTYRVKHDTTVTEVVDGAKRQFKSHLELLKRYRVMDVGADGIATLDYTVTEMRTEQTRPNGDVLRFDSTDPTKSTPELRGQLGKYVGSTLAVLRIDITGTVTAVKQGSSQHLTEPPFTLVLPRRMPILEGGSWKRDFDLTLDPPLGTGEKYAARQELRCTKLAEGKATIAIKTSFSKLPEAVQERIPLVQKEAQGNVVFDTAAGRVVSVRLTVDRMLMNHQGEGSSYRYESTYTEELVAR